MNHYLLTKVVHLVFMVSWFAALFYIFRLFVYHAREKASPSTCRTLAEMERKLINYIMWPASVCVLLSGLTLSVLNASVWRSPWFHAKLTFVLFLFIYQLVAVRTQRKFSRGEFCFTERQCRWINEVPTIILIVVLLLVVMKPF